MQTTMESRTQSYSAGVLQMIQSANLEEGDKIVAAEKERAGT